LGITCHQVGGGHARCIEPHHEQLLQRCGQTRRASLQLPLWCTVSLRSVIPAPLEPTALVASHRIALVGARGDGVYLAPRCQAAGKRAADHYRPDTPEQHQQPLHHPHRAAWMWCPSTRTACCGAQRQSQWPGGARRGLPASHPSGDHLPHMPFHTRRGGCGRRGGFPPAPRAGTEELRVGTHLVRHASRKYPRIRAIFVCVSHRQGAVEPTPRYHHCRRGRTGWSIRDSLTLHTTSPFHPAFRAAGVP